MTVPTNPVVESMKMKGFNTRIIFEGDAQIGIIAWHPTMPILTANVEKKDTDLFVASPENQTIFVIARFGTIQDGDGQGQAYICPWSAWPQVMLWPSNAPGPVSPIPLWSFEALPPSVAHQALTKWLAWRAVMNEVAHTRITDKWDHLKIGATLSAQLSQALT